MRGKFIVLEGPEGGGKTLQSRLLTEKLEAIGHEVVTTHEPGGTAIGQEIRTILLSLDGYDVRPETEVFLLAAGRVQHIHEVILPALNRGCMVVCDRFVDSTYAYQGGGRGIADDLIRPIQDLATTGLQPDLKLLLDLPVEEGLSRRGGHKSGQDFTVQMGFDFDDGMRSSFTGRRTAGQSETNKIDMFSVDFHRRVRIKYLDLVQQTPDNWVVIDATANIDQVESQIWSAVQAMLSGE